MSGKYKTPMLDELEKGPWPSFVTEIKRARESSSMPDMADDELGQVEKSFSDLNKAIELADKHGWFLCHQFENEANANKHSTTTAVEIMADSHVHPSLINSPHLKRFGQDTRTLRTVHEFYQYEFQVVRLTIFWAGLLVLKFI